MYFTKSFRFVPFGPSLQLWRVLLTKAPTTPKRAKPVAQSEPPTRSTLTFRLRNEVRRDVERAATKYGRSLSEEIENRLEISLAHTQYIRRELGEDIFSIAQAMAASLSYIEDWSGKGWVEDEETHEIFQATVSNLLKNYRDLATRAEGRTSPSGTFDGKSTEERGQMFAALGGLAPPRSRKPAPPQEPTDEQREARAVGMDSMRKILAEQSSNDAGEA